jgi:hypothetical protein
LFNVKETLRLLKKSITAKTRGLVKFDLSTIPANASVVNATLYLTVVADAADNTRTMGAYRVKRNWDESQATWNIYSGWSQWATAGASGTDDIDGTAMGSVTVPANAAYGDVIEIQLSHNEVTKLIDGTYANYGWLFKMDTEINDKHDYASSTSTIPSHRPRLVLEYTTATQPAAWTDRKYTYAQAQPHAVTALSTGAAYTYDNNGNTLAKSASAGDPAERLFLLLYLSLPGLSAYNSQHISRYNIRNYADCHACWSLPIFLLFRRPE